MSSCSVITIPDEAKKVSFSEVEEIIHREEDCSASASEICNSIQIRCGGIVTIQCKDPSVDKDDRPLFIVNITLADGQLVAIVQDSQVEDELQYHVPVRSIKHRVSELKEAVERLNSQANYFKFDQDVIKFVKEVTGKTPKELKRQKLMKTVAIPSTESRKRGREEEKEENPAKRAKSGDEEKEEQCTDDQEYSFKKLIGLRFTENGQMFFHVLWSTDETTWEPWMEFKDYTRLIKKMIKREIRNGFQFTKQQKKTFEANIGMREEEEQEDSAARCGEE